MTRDNQPKKTTSKNVKYLQSEVNRLRPFEAAHAKAMEIINMRDGEIDNLYKKIKELDSEIAHLKNAADMDALSSAGSDHFIEELKQDLSRAQDDDEEKRLLLLTLAHKDAPTHDCQKSLAKELLGEWYPEKQCQSCGATVQTPPEETECDDAWHKR